MLGLSHEMDAEKPGREGETCAREERTSGEGILAHSGFSLEDLAGTESALASLAAVPADEALWPTRPIDGFGTLVFTAEKLQEHAHAQAFLESDSAVFLRITRCRSVIYISNYS